ncbi:heme A synthase CtaA [Afipia carboxidovorans OM5]|uniref:Heme A synthase n=1 Tax=Afipia carboxidovorans (strain ATCC 49405 / DSM 1227 / KCTC 32145 / OM5) TaxID=504832 RepID=F8BX55_AFIC5|nr:COX15/CtaA family protein [Afipia carboxidovorans]AEI03255.1 heme A synthase CtaA [Afipia carboxidovorans OM4]AEI06832.1 heme A synthase CtaA [Afipia carboxidovorans OM5]
MTHSPDIPAKTTKSHKAIRIWLGFVAAMIVCTLLVGGATRLTESGLSITEWKPVSGMMPPLSAQAWDAEFEAYKKIPQYREMNSGMSLSEFKTIFWWEWAHRLLARSIGVVFFLPFLFFLIRGGLDAALKRRLWVLFALGGLQGAVGWWMVKSGLSERVSVSQYRLAIHFLLALLIFSATVWTMRGLAPRVSRVAATARAALTSRILLGLIFLQLYFGALVAGLRAGKIYNTWPEIDGGFIPPLDQLFFEKPWWRNFFDSTLTVQFTHRMIAYTLFAVALYHLVDVIRTKAAPAAVRGAVWLMAAMSLQLVIGIFTLLHQVPISLGLLHQATAIVVLTLALLQTHRLQPGEPTMAQGLVPTFR